jgi:exosortase
MLIRAADVPVIRDGNLLALGNVTLEVARECSGIRTVISLVTLGLVFGYVADPRPALRVLVAAATIPVVVLTNSARVAGTGIATHYYGRAAATGFFHDLAGWLAFAAAFAIMLLMHRLLVQAVAERTLTPPPANAHIQS